MYNLFGPVTRAMLLVIHSSHRRREVRAVKCNVRKCVDPQWDWMKRVHTGRLKMHKDLKVKCKDRNGSVDKSLAGLIPGQRTKDPNDLHI